MGLIRHVMRQLHRVTVLFFLIYRGEMMMSESALERGRTEVETRLKSAERQDAVSKGSVVVITGC